MAGTTPIVQKSPRRGSRQQGSLCARRTKSSRASDRRAYTRCVRMDTSGRQETKAGNSLKGGCGTRFGMKKSQGLKVVLATQSICSATLSSGLHEHGITSSSTAGAGVAQHCRDGVKRRASQPMTGQGGEQLCSALLRDAGVVKACWQGNLVPFRQ